MTMLTRGLDHDVTAHDMGTELIEPRGKRADSRFEGRRRLHARESNLEGLFHGIYLISRTRKIRVESHINTRLRSRSNQYWPQSQTSRDPALRSSEGFGRERCRAVVPPRRTHPRLAGQTEGRR